MGREERHQADKRRAESSRIILLHNYQQSVSMPDSQNYTQKHDRDNHCIRLSSFRVYSF